MKKIIKSPYVFLFFVLALGSCSDSAPDYSQYLNEIKYSSKISNLTGSAGIENVRLEWLNPDDQVAKRIRIEYGEGLFIETEEMESAYTITGLTSGSGYVFTVYTLDAYGNKSIGTDIFLSPVTREYMDSYLEKISTVSPTVKIQDDDLIVHWSDMKQNAFLKYTGRIEYTYILGGDTYEGSSESDKDNEETVTIPGVTSPGTVILSYTMKYLPVVNNVLLMDEVTKTVRIEISVDYPQEKNYVEIDHSKCVRRLGIAFDNTTDFSAYYSFTHLFDGINAENRSWVSSSPDVDPAKGGNKENNSDFPLSITVDIGDAIALTHIEYLGWENMSQAPKKFEVWGTDAVEEGKPEAYWATTVPGDWQNDWVKLGNCEGTDATRSGYKFAINSAGSEVRYVRILVYEVFKPVNHIRVAMSELKFYQEDRGLIAAIK